MAVPDSVKSAIRKFAVGTEVVLYEVDLTPLGGPVYHFTNTIFEERVPIKFGGNTYTVLPIAMSDVSVDAQGAPSQPTLAIATGGGPVASLIQQYGDLRRAIVRRFSTFAEFLDEFPLDDTPLVDESEAFFTGAGFSGSGPWVHAGTAYGEVRFPMPGVQDGEKFIVTVDKGDPYLAIRIGGTGQIGLVGSGTHVVELTAADVATFEGVRVGTVSDGAALNSVSVVRSNLNPNADSAARIKEELFIVNRKNSADKTFAEFQLRSPADLEGAKLPARICRKRWCMAKYRVQNDDGSFYYFPPEDGGCPWGNTTPDGGNYYDVNNQPTTKENDRCSKQMSGCLARFGNNAPLPFDALPGIRGPNEA